MTPADLERLSRQLAELDQEHKAKRAALFESAGVSAADYYEAFWKAWKQANAKSSAALVFGNILREKKR